uniref:Chemokine interleukin-8-like domain-containing protein n=1 Tax=Sinocyclocheilus rhinocerous TaxID=307959 RepID=A0A673HVU1_9TELE
KQKAIDRLTCPIGLLGSSILAQHKVKSCCTKVSKAKVTNRIISFRRQNESLPCVKAVIFKTERGEFCCDPRQRWVKKKVEHDQTRVGGSTQATDSSPVMNIKK